MRGRRQRQVGGVVRRDDPTVAVELGRWWRRAAAVVIDTLIGGVIVIATAIAVSIVNRGTHLADILGVVWLFSVMAGTAAYFAVTMRRGGARNGQTLGKQLMRLRVVRDDGRRVGAGTAVGRDFFLKVGAGLVTGLGWFVDGLWPLRDRENRTIHDLVAKTHVIAAPVDRGDRAFYPVPWCIVRFLGSAERLTDPVLAGHLREVHAAEVDLRMAGVVESEEVMAELDNLVQALEHALLRAHLLRQALQISPPRATEGELANLPLGGERGRGDESQWQLRVEARMRLQVDRAATEAQRVTGALRTHLEKWDETIGADPRDAREFAATLRTLRRDVETIDAATADVFE